jgi:hypothetical protein
VLTHGIFHNRDTIEGHLARSGFDWDFTKDQKKHHHLAAGPIVRVDDYDDLDDHDNHDDRGATSKLFTSLISGAIHGGIKGGNEEEPNESAHKFFGLLEQAKIELYPSCKEASKVSFIARIYQIKCMCGLSNTAMEQILSLFRLVLPERHCLLDSLDKVRKVVQDLGLDYQKIHARVNDYVLFRGVYADMDNCPTCKFSRWKFTDSEQGTGVVVADVAKKKWLSCKILWYFPLIPLLQRLFMNEEISTYMRWHKDKMIDDKKLRHPTNSRAWKVMNYAHEDFAEDPRNVKLGLASNGFNPFGMLSLAYSTWLVILISYNLPLWLCLKQSYWIMPMLIPRPKSTGINIVVYLQPPIDELKTLWSKDEVETWDAKAKRNFQMCAMLLWTINNFTAYAMLSGWSTKGRFACSYYHKDTECMWLKFSSKHYYMGHRCFLSTNHKW